MSDFMMSQVQGLLAKVSDDVEKMGENTTAQTEMLLGAINDLAANMFATQAILCVLLRDHPVDAAKAPRPGSPRRPAARTQPPRPRASSTCCLASITRRKTNPIFRPSQLRPRA